MLNTFAEKLQVLDLAPAASNTATVNGTGVDLIDYEGNVAIVLDSAAGTGTSPTMAVKIQDSADNSSFADVAGAAFTQVTNAAPSVQKIVVNSNEIRRYIRVVKTIGGTTPAFINSVKAFGVKKYT